MSKPWKSTSASQITAYARCKRKWFFGWIERARFPPTPAQQRGTDIHAEVEHYLKTGVIRDSDYTKDRLNYRSYVEALKPHLPPPKHPELIVEHFFKLETGVVPLVGYIDIGFSQGNPLWVRDVKSTSDFRYAKTPEELRWDIQLNIYGKFAYEQGHDGLIELAHVYVKTGKKVPKKPKTKLVPVLVDRESVEGVWDACIERTVQMSETAKLTSFDAVEPTGIKTGECYAFGGCPFQSKCGIGLFSDTQTKGKTMGFFDKVKGNGKNGQTTPPPDVQEVVAQPSPAPVGGMLSKLRAQAQTVKTDTARQPVPGQILPNDAPSRETTAADLVAAEPEKKTRKRKAAKTSVASEGLTLFVDCIPLKGVGGVEPTMFEDWINGVVMALNETLAQEENVSDYRLLAYSKEKLALTTAVQAQLEKSCPSMMLLSSGSSLARDSMDVLAAHATQVIRGTR